ncbi:sensor histidine kinase [Halopiger xanaduensis]|uniref:histidine kinase n=1 Tax=Halopiger xanaduensis (strain DSM 18323 / JCM 14033 / SH-6) TaxID=797210 RepID=F8DAI8_HALXS|nr:HAMP domain-containing sensor histidine kinase [Halopiger xanaduensis]AEH35793.1 GAF sensor signal transduction histidine kinase [Halopiger xanaduensis SH-6]
MAGVDRDRDGDRDSRRSFHVRYADVDGGREGLAAAIEPPYRVTDVAADEVDDLRGAVDPDVDCLVVTEAFRERIDGRSWADSLESVRAARPSLPIVPVVPSFDPDRVRSLVRADVADVVCRADRSESSDAGAAPESDPAARLRARIDDVYDASISDVSGTVLEIARSLMGAAPDEVDVEIEWALGSIGARLNADRCLVFDYDEEAARLEPTHAWDAARSGADSPESAPTASASVPDVDGTLSADASDVEPMEPSAFPGFEDSLREYDAHAIPPTTDRPEIDVPDGFIGDLGPNEGGEAGDTHPYLERRGLEALLAVPIVIDWELRGVLVVGQDHRRPWPDRLCRQLRTLGELIGHTIERTRRRRELVRKNEHLERFASVISHDLRNPLNVISGTADLIAETEELHRLEHIAAAADRMESMIDDLLLLARDGAKLGSIESVPLESVVRDAWTGVETSDATLETRDLPTVAADPGRLQQALENLVRNAVEHNDAGVGILVEGTDDGFALEDDGAGVPPDRRERVFEEGYSGAGGTGLGLSIVETVVSAHGWDVSVTDGKQGGARFEIATSDATEPVVGSVAKAGFDSDSQSNSNVPFQ